MTYCKRPLKDLTPEQIQRNAKKDGLIVSTEQAAEVLKFLEILAEITVDAYLEGKA